MRRKNISRSNVAGVLRGITEHLLDDLKSGRVPGSGYAQRPITIETINDGYCGDWAIRAKKAIGGALIWIEEEWSEPGTFNWSTKQNEFWGHEARLSDHVCLRHKGRYYDAENPEGVDRVEDLKFIVDRSR